MSVFLEKVSPEILIFLGKAGITALALLIVAVLIIILLSNLGLRTSKKAYLEATSLNDEWNDRKRSLESLFTTKKEWKAKIKNDQKAEKIKNKEGLKKPRVWVLDFNGDIEASRTECLRNEITSILEIATAKTDEVLLRLESPGGSVTGYGLAASQLIRLKKAGIRLTIAIDEVAASGGYMMAAVADHLIASPFSVIGSIGVIGQIPNFHRLLKKTDIDYLQLTAGKNKRPISMFGEITEFGVTKFQTQLNETHDLFKTHVHTYRPQLEIDQIATGDIWYGSQALSLGLIDEVSTSDEWLDRARREFDREVFTLSWKPAKSWRARFEDSAARALTKSMKKSLKTILYEDPTTGTGPFMR